MSTEESSAELSESVLVVDDEESVRTAVAAILNKQGFEVETAASGKEALELLTNHSFDIVFSDLKMPEMDGLEFLSAFKAAGHVATVIIMSAFGTIPIAIEAMKRGAYDYISKPFNADEILLAIRKASERERLRKENQLLRDQVEGSFSFKQVITKSAAVKEIFQTIQKVADYKTTILLEGESGTGKEVIARSIHQNSNRSRKKFVAINCAAIPENLLESELFGHKKGSFTDATKDKRGLFEEASGGTVFLDEIGELPLHLQVKLLRVLQEEEILPVGATTPQKIDVRVIAATLRDLEQDVRSGRFREDLYYRLNVISLKLPPLRERKEDIPLLVKHFLKKHSAQLSLPVESISQEALAALVSYDWPGNIRELENCIERAIILSGESEIGITNLPKAVLGNTDVQQQTVVDPEDLSIKNHSRALEERLIRAALGETGGNRTQAAKLLEISHRTLLYKLKEYELENIGK